MYSTMMQYANRDWGYGFFAIYIPLLIINILKRY